MRLWHASPFVGARARMRRGGAVAHPKATGQVKTNRRDGASLARLHGELTAVSVRMPSTGSAATSRSEDIARGRGSRP